MVTWLSLLLSRLRFRGRYRVVDVVDAADELPEVIPTHGAVVVGALQHPTWIAFDCPCDEHHRIMLNLDPRRRPWWTLTTAKPLTLRPSVDALVGNRRCHYIINKGKVRWVPCRTGSESIR